MEANDFSEMLGYLDFQMQQQSESNSTRAAKPPAGKIPQTMGQ
tara:strand:- start:1110 stop:1238 length:129 start_codon:yes stop_codon:yes gene_type:complete